MVISRLSELYDWLFDYVPKPVKKAVKIFFRDEK